MANQKNSMDIQDEALGPAVPPEIVASTDGRQEAGILFDDDQDTGLDGPAMSIVDHLDEMRTRIVRSLFVFALGLGVCLYYGRDLVRLLERPAGNMQFQALSLEEPMLVYLKVSLYGALLLVSPWLVYEIAGFVWPGLRPNERRIIKPVAIGSPLLFVGGAAFCYFLVLPPMLAFFNSFGLGMTPVHQRLDFYVSLVLTFMLYMGLVFQLPIVLFALSFAGLVNSRQLISVWRYAIFASGFVAAVITPDPTVVSMLIVMAALVTLYFSTVWLLRLFGK